MLFLAGEKRSVYDGTPVLWCTARRAYFQYSIHITFTPALGSGLGLSEGNSNTYVTPNVAPSKSESPVPQNEKVSSTQPAVEVAKPVDFPSPKPIPEGMVYSHLLNFIVIDSTY